MSVIIKGMKMPKGCDTCEWIYWSNLYQVYACKLTEKALGITNGTKQRSYHCPLVEIPQGADLVDRNCLLSEYDRQHKGPAGGARKIMEDAPTIFEEKET